MPKASSKISEPSIIVKPVSRFGGLDNIHVALIILVAILILVVIAISYNTKITVINETQNSTQTCVSNCITPTHNATQARMYAERVLAGYSSLNGTVSLLPYLTNVSAMKASFLPALRQWYVSMPYTNPSGNATYTITIAIYDSNLTLAGTLFQGVSPPVSKNYVVAPGVIQLAGQTSCSSSGSVQQDWFIDPYSPGGIQSLTQLTSLQNEFGSKINASIKPLFTQYSDAVSSTYGVNSTENLEKYILCGSQQSNFTGFVAALNASYSGSYMPLSVLQGIAAKSGFNGTSFNSCIANSQSAIDAETVVARYYNITSSPSVLTDCQYISLPQTSRNAICYARPGLC